MRLFLMLGMALLSAWGARLMAQADPALILSNTQIGTQPDSFGGEMPVVFGDVYNFGSQAYGQIQLYVDVHDADGEQIGEGFGYLVDACGTALLDYALPPARLQSFQAPFELFADGEAASVQVRIDAAPLDYAPRPPLETEAVTQISSDEAVMLEWLDEERLRYGVGCDGAVFTELDWWGYHLADHALTAIAHPKARWVDAAMIEQSGAAMITQSGEQNPDLFYGSAMVFAPNARRAVYQNDLHTIMSAEPDGSFKRLIHDGLHQHSLRGFLWGARPGLFLAYYFGAYGEPAHYFTGNVDGALLMGPLQETPPSLTVPGVAADGLAVVAGRQIDGISGYYWQTAYGGTELLFEAELPGNNYPAPLVFENRLVYVIRPIKGTAYLQCYHRETGELKTISALPLDLTRETRAWAWLSPGGTRLAVAANGAGGGLWWVNLTAGSACDA